MNKQMHMGQERDGDNNMSARSSPRMMSSENDGPLLKRPKIESNSDGDDLQQVSQLTRQKQQSHSHVIINLED